MRSSLKLSTRQWWILALVVLIVGMGSLIVFAPHLNTHRLVDPGQVGREEGLEARLDAGQAIGQTFVAHHSGLAGIEFFLSPEGASAQTLTLHLRTNPEATEDLATTTHQLPSNTGPGFYRFDFSPLTDSRGGYYYAFLEASESPDGTAEATSIFVALAAGPSYQDGAAHANHDPLDAQTTFRLVYATDDVLLGLIKTAAGWPGLLLVAFLLFIVPGWALLAWALPADRLSWAETLGLAAGVSLALYTLILLWTDLVGLHLGPLYAWAPPVAGVAALAIRYRDWRPGRGLQSIRQWAKADQLWPDLALLLTLGLVFVVRMLVVGTLKVPMWGDSYQHTMASQLMADNGGLFDSWEPYAPLVSFTYHYGFQAAVTLFHWFVGANMLDATIVVGQIVNALAVLSLYSIAVKIGGSRWTGVGAVLVAGLLSPMPMYYMNWGRYVQLAGQVILPAACWLIWSSLEHTERKLGVELLAGLAAAGLVLTHYRVTVFLVVFVPIAWMVATFHARQRKSAVREPFFRVLRIALAAFLLILPWIWHLFAGLLPSILGEISGTKAGATPPQQSQILRDTPKYVPVYLIAAALAGLIAGIVRRRQWIPLLALWTGLLFVAANPNWLGLPAVVTVSNFEGVLNNFTVQIGLYMSISVLCGYLFSSVLDALPFRLPAMRQVLALVLILVFSIWGARQSLNAIDTRYTLVTTPDLRAMEWIREQTPVTARFLTNFFFAYDDNVIVGSDAGWWIPFLTLRQNTTPPITYGQEAARKPDYIAQVNGFAHFLLGHDLDEPETIQALKDRNITHVYIGQKGGNFPVETLLATDAYNLEYHKDRVWIFSVR